jgi:NADPH:quinone reductase-like Zn-dependent oxidoreductase
MISGQLLGRRVVDNAPMATMRAVRYERYGSPEVLQLVDMPGPVPKDDEVLVRVHATTVNRTDCGFRQGKPLIVRFFSGLRRPRHQILGTELSGVVEEIGGAVTSFAVGDEVFGVNADRFGAHAELICVRQTAPLERKPASLPFEEAAAVCDGAILALTCLRWSGLSAGQRILIYGASGAIGTAGVQLAKHLSSHVTAVCNTKNVDVVRSLGADEVIDYTREDFIAGRGPFDVVFDAVGKISFWACRAALTKRGRFVSTDFGPRGQVPLLALATAVTSRLWSRRVSLPIPRYTQRDVRFLAELVEAGAYRPVIDRQYPLADVIEATEYVETEQKTGNVVLIVGASSP